MSRQVIELELVRGPSEASLKAGIECYLVEDYSRAIRHLENTPEGLFNLGRTCLKLGDLERASDSFERITKSGGMYRARAE